MNNFSKSLASFIKKKRGGGGEGTNTIVMKKSWIAKDSYFKNGITKFLEKHKMPKIHKNELKIMKKIYIEEMVVHKK